MIDVYEIDQIRPAEKKSQEEWSSQLWTQFEEAWKTQDFNWIWTLSRKL